MKKNRFPLISPLLIAGILLILLPIFTFMTLDRLKKQKEFSTQRFMGRGISLIRTFEAGTRTGLFTMGWGAKRIQTMLYETSLQPEIVYMMITSKDGKILAHSDFSMVGEIFKSMPVIEEMNQDIPLFNHRERLLKDQTQVFEIFKPFTPHHRKFNKWHMQRQKMLMHKDIKNSSINKFGIQQSEWFQQYHQSQQGKKMAATKNYIFVALSMANEKNARQRVLKQTIMRGFSFFILGCAGLIALFAFQGYRSAKASLTQVKAFSDSVIENMPSGLITINLDYEITSINKTAKKIFSNNQESFLPQLIELIKNGKLSKGIINQQINFNIDSDTNLDILKKDIQQRSINLDITASSIKNSEGKITAFLLLFKDLTQIKDLKKQVETNKRLAAIGKLAAGVAHEIRNPLSSIKGFATYFGKRYEKNSSDKETALIMVKEVERINRSITQLLEFAKPMKIEKKSVDINDLIEHSLKLVDHDIAQKKIFTQIDINLKTTLIYTDSDRMNQVLLNLYINAIQAMEEGGKLQITAEDKQQNGLIEIRVKDNGSGIDKETIDHVFDPYFTTHSTGTGLGLSIVHTIIENMGGTIKVQSSKGKGACFIINLPVS